jgi:hypothetical protein
MPPSPQALPATSRAKGAVSKKLSPGMPGTLRLLERYGAALVCVRYREIEAPDGARRLTRYRHFPIATDGNRFPDPDVNFPIWNHLMTSRWASYDHDPFCLCVGR